MDESPLKLLDLYCGEGGASKGYVNAGFEVVGVDLFAMPYYPFEFVQADALEYDLSGFDAIHASPPCQAFSKNAKQHGTHEDHPDHIELIRERLIEAAVPYIIENVPGAPLIDPVQLCGSSFGLDLQRHRLFESNVSLVAPPCNHSLHTPRFRRPDKRVASLASVVQVNGERNYAGELELRRNAMKMPWASNRGLTQAIPPAYTEFLGRQLRLHILARRGLAA